MARNLDRSAPEWLTLENGLGALIQMIDMVVVATVAFVLLAAVVGVTRKLTAEPVRQKSEPIYFEAPSVAAPADDQPADPTR